VSNEFSLTSEQEKALNLNKDLLVLAGAGSGKTRVLTERYIHLVEKSIESNQPLHPGNILVVTFTEKAAGEMKERIQSHLENKKGGPWKKFLEGFLDNQISTFHSLCARILQSYPLAGKVDPDFKILQGFDQKQFLTEVIEREINLLARRKDEGLLCLLNEWRFRQLKNNLLDLVEKRYDLMTTLKEYELSTEQELMNRWAGGSGQYSPGLEKLLIRLQSIPVFAELDINAADQGLNFLKKLADLFEKSKALSSRAPDWEKAMILRELLELFIGSGGDYLAMKSYHQVGVKKNWKDYPREHQEVKRLLKEIKEEMEQIIPAEKIDLLPNSYDLEMAKIMPHLAAIARRCIAAYQKNKGDRNWLDFNDLEGFTHEILSTEAEVAASLGRRYPYIMVDEFQDTNKRQWEIIKAIADGGEKSNLFLVGDVKQAIYSFRGGDVTIFNRARKEMEETGNDLVFARNFRSCEPLIDFFNSFFGCLLGASEAEYEAPFQKLRAAGENKDYPGEVELTVIVNQKEDRWERIRREADVVASRAQELLSRLPEKGKNPRLAILMRRLTNIHHYEQALQERGVSFTTIRGRGFFNQQEILDLCNLLLFLEDPGRDVELIGLLRSPLVGVSDREIYELFREQGDSLWEKMINSSQEKWLTIGRIIEQWLKLKDYLALGELLQRIIQKTRFYLSLNLGDDRKQKVLNVEKFLEIARDFSRGGRGLGEFVDFLEQQLSSPDQEAEALTEVETDVAIMSIHQAKGLQFPGVILADLGGRFNLGQADPIRTACLEGREELGMGVLDPQSGLRAIPALRQRIGNRKKAEQLAEEKRLFYVAATRAQLYLELIGSRKEGNRSIEDLSQGLSFLDWLELAYGGPEFPGAEGVMDVRKIGPEDKLGSGRITPPPNFGSIAPDLKPEQKKGWSPPALSWNKIVEINPTDLILFKNCPRRYYYSRELLIERENVSRRKMENNQEFRLEGQKIGQLLHGLLEDDSFCPGEKTWVKKFQELNILPSQREQYREELKKHLNYLQVSDWLDRIKRADCDISEKKFRVLWKQDGQYSLYLTGVVDRLLLEKDRWVLLDFKTNRLGEQTPEEMTYRNNYQLQLACYREGLQRLKPPVNIAEAWIIYSGAGESQKIDYGETERLKLEKVIEDFLNRNFIPRPGTHCSACQYSAICPGIKKGGNNGWS